MKTILLSAFIATLFWSCGEEGAPTKRHPVCAGIINFVNAEGTPIYMKYATENTGQVLSSLSSPILALPA